MFSLLGFDSRRRTFRRSTPNRSFETNVARVRERVRSDFERSLPFLSRDRGGRLSRFRGVLRVTNQWCALSFTNCGAEVISRPQRICLQQTRWRVGRRACLARSDNHRRQGIRADRTESLVLFVRKPAMHPVPT